MALIRGQCLFKISFPKQINITTFFVNSELSVSLLKAYIRHTALHTRCSARLGVVLYSIFALKCGAYLELALIRVNTVLCIFQATIARV